MFYRDINDENAGLLNIQCFPVAVLKGLEEQDVSCSVKFLAILEQYQHVGLTVLIAGIFACKCVCVCVCVCGCVCTLSLFSVERCVAEGYASRMSKAPVSGKSLLLLSVRPYGQESMSRRKTTHGATNTLERL